jgi:hypothetical protein
MHRRLATLSDHWETSSANMEYPDILWERKWPSGWSTQKGNEEIRYPALELGRSDQASAEAASPGAKADVDLWQRKAIEHCFADAL